MVISGSDFISFLYTIQSEKLFGYQKIITVTEKESGGARTLNLSTLQKDSKVVLDSFHSIEPVKILYYLPRLKVYPVNQFNEKLLLVGVKACDLKALQILDKALLSSDFIDPDYKQWRDNITVITSDCTEIGEFCHCNLKNGKPYSENGFDLNLSPINGSYLITIGSEKGEALFEEMKKHTNVADHTDKDLNRIKALRARIETKLTEQNKKFEFDYDYINLKKNPINSWKDDSKECVGCGGCTNICPSCYCLILNDDSKLEQFVKVRSYDSCQLNGYARVAGGATPRPKMHERFRHRYLCKHIYFQSNFGELGCTGCGRCSEVCPAKIDFRETVYKQIQIQEELTEK
jgi:formate hydrogenlyase subunit 6/NADH:ubiquinone oxidoreductase subunit I